MREGWRIGEGEDGSMTEAELAASSGRAERRAAEAMRSALESR
jgi:hypothetical protein